MRMNDLQNDYQRVASECCSLLTQKETLVEKNLEHESQIRFLESKMKNFEDDLKAKNETIEANKKLIDELNKKNDITDSKFKDMLDDNILLKDEIEIGKKREQALKDEISELKIELERQRRVIKNIRHSSVLGSPMNRTISNSPSYEEAGFESYEGSNYNSNNNSFMISNNVDSAILPPLLEEVPNSNNMNIMDNNGDDIGDRVPEGTIKVNLQHKINSDGAAGALSMLLSSQNVSFSIVPAPK